jgi:hypothetical protein
VRCGFGEFCEGGFHSNVSVRSNPGCVIGNCGWIIDIVRSSLVSFCEIFASIVQCEVRL